jgi:hypothetical protein
MAGSRIDKSATPFADGLQVEAMSPCVRSLVIVIRLAFQRDLSAAEKPHVALPASGPGPGLGLPALLW